MAVAPADTATKQRLRLCSVVAKASGEDPIGTAWAPDRCLAVEIPLPWPPIFVEARGCPAGLPEVMLASYRDHPTWGFLGFAPDSGYSRDGWTRVIDFHYPPSPRAAAHRAEYLVRHDQVATFVAAVLAGDIPEMPGVEPQPFAGRDLMVCTHGTVDACCARFGYPLYRHLREIAGHRSDSVRVWRATHFGGHRFAPTVLDLPEGRYWGFIGRETAAPLVLRDGDARALRSCYRGWAGYEEPEAQLLEREALIHEGWAWTTWPQELEILDRDADGNPTHLRLRAYPAVGPAIAYEGRIADANEVETLYETDGDPVRRRLHQIVDLRRSTFNATR